MAQADQLDLLKLLLEANRVEDPERRCQQLHEHSVTTLNEFAVLKSKERLLKWGIAGDDDDDDDDNVCASALPHAQKLLQDNPHDLAAIKQQLLVRACMC